MAIAPLLAIFRSHYWGTHCTQRRPCLAEGIPRVPSPDQVLVPAPFLPLPLPLCFLLRTHHPSHPPSLLLLLPHHTPSSVFLLFYSIAWQIRSSVSALTLGCFVFFYLRKESQLHSCNLDPC
ncbi:hypothetical protein F5Y12DRAFT_482556 [Xylaria sp. FL1777]|nr:hypothetical protein F5Y12DRAFT_482556 [Xylaria sp. FL1777]